MKLQSINWGNPVSSNGLNSGLVSWWLARLGINGNIWYDLTKLNNLTLNSSPTWGSSTRQGNPFQLTTDGSASYASGTVTQINSAAACTISAWINRSATGTKNCFGFNNSGTDRFNVLWFSDNNVYCDFGAAFPNFASTATGWHHLVHVYDGGAATKQIAYLDGVAKTLSGTPTSATTLASTTGSAYWTGREQTNGFCTGQHDDLRVYNRALSAGEVMQLYSDPYNLLMLNRLSIFGRPYNNIITSQPTIFTKKIIGKNFRLIGHGSKLIT